MVNSYVVINWNDEFEEYNKRQEALNDGKLTLKHVDRGNVDDYIYGLSFVEIKTLCNIQNPSEKQMFIVERINKLTKNKKKFIKNKLEFVGKQKLHKVTSFEERLYRINLKFEEIKREAVEEETNDPMHSYELGRIQSDIKWDTKGEKYFFDVASSIWPDIKYLHFTLTNELEKNIDWRTFLEQMLSFHEIMLSEKYSVILYRHPPAAKDTKFVRFGVSPNWFITGTIRKNETTVRFYSSSATWVPEYKTKEHGKQQEYKMSLSEKHKGEISDKYDGIMMPTKLTLPYSEIKSCHVNLNEIGIVAFKQIRIYKLPEISDIVWSIKIDKKIAEIKQFTFNDIVVCFAVNTTQYSSSKQINKNLFSILYVVDRLSKNKLKPIRLKTGSHIDSLYLQGTDITCAMSDGSVHFIKHEYGKKMGLFFKTRRMLIEARDRKDEVEAIKKKHERMKNMNILFKPHQPHIARYHNGNLISVMNGSIILKAKLRLSKSRGQKIKKYRVIDRHDDNPFNIVDIEFIGNIIVFATENGMIISQRIGSNKIISCYSEKRYTPNTKTFGCVSVKREDFFILYINTYGRAIKLLPHIKEN